MANFTPKPEAFSETTSASMDALSDSMKSAEETQKHTTSTLSEINNYWLARTKDEAEELAALVQNVVGKSPSAAIPACQDWFAGRMQRASDDSKKLLEHSQTLVTSMMPKH